MIRKEVMKMLSVKETADLFGVTKRTIFRWIKSGKMKSVKIGRTVRIKESEIKRVIGEGEYHGKDA